MAVTFLRFPALFLSCTGVGSWLVSTSHRPLRLSSDFNGLSFRVGHPRTPAGQDDPQDAWAARRPMKSVPPRAGNLAVVRSYQLRKALTVKSMTTIGHVFIPLNREHDCMVPTDDDQARFERLAGSARAMGAVPTMPFQAPVGADGGQFDREEMFWFDAGHVNAMMLWWRRRRSPPRRTCATGSCRLPPSLVAPLIATWASFLLFLERRSAVPRRRRSPTGPAR